MIHDVHDPGFVSGVVYDADTGERLPLVYRWDDETGEYWHYVPNAQGYAQQDPKNPNEAWKAHGKRRRLKFVPFDANGKAEFTALPMVGVSVLTPVVKWIDIAEDIDKSRWKAFQNAFLPAEEGDSDVAALAEAAGVEPERKIKQIELLMVSVVADPHPDCKMKEPEPEHKIKFREFL